MCSLPDKPDAAPAKAEVIWSKNEGGTWALGLKIVDMAPEARSEFLDSCYAQWQEKRGVRSQLSTFSKADSEAPPSDAKKVES